MKRFTGLAFFFGLALLCLGCSSGGADGGMMTSGTLMNSSTNTALNQQTGLSTANLTAIEGSLVADRVIALQKDSPAVSKSPSMMGSDSSTFLHMGHMYQTGTVGSSSWIARGLETCRVTMESWTATGAHMFIGSESAALMMMPDGYRIMRGNGQEMRIQGFMNGATSATIMMDGETWMMQRSTSPTQPTTLVNQANGVTLKISESDSGKLSVTTMDNAPYSGTWMPDGTMAMSGMMSGVMKTFNHCRGGN